MSIYPLVKENILTTILLISVISLSQMGLRVSLLMTIPRLFLEQLLKQSGLRTPIITLYSQLSEKLIVHFT